MQDHPIPQAVTSYEFHLIGNMTLKQFLELGAGILLGVVIYQTNLYSVIKWPLIVFFVGLGAMIAFVPYEGRPLDQWFIALFRAIYKPTLFYWRKSGNLPDYLTYTTKETTTFQDELDLSPLKQQRIYEYIHTLPDESALDPLAYQEAQQMSAVLSLFDTVHVETVDAVELLTKPDLTAQQHPLQQFDNLFKTNVPYEDERLTAEQIPETLPPSIEEVTVPVEAPAPETTSEVVDVFNAASLVVDDPTAQHSAALNVQTSDTLPFPKKPTQPNIVVGMVFDQVGNIVENAIVEIADDQGMPVRAVRTNKIGQFYISTPLKNGEYFMKAEKEGILFPTQKLELNNTILDPIEIRASE
ncbi:MAG: PrgI family protein [Patescibacteria group bacterium]